ncbi:T9SS type A sorting domain-containing protein [Chryseobacterium sp. RLHN22]|uniref:T9SS type A sorting domain-containing protein n=1 Tax=Chryseobacterium sp. RLHN22 TaxID=3437885 RepID=UPI003D9B570A
MKTKIILTIALFIGLFKTFAQSYEEEYLYEEQIRLNHVQIIENEIQIFINQKINTTDFTEVINNVNNIKDEEGNSLSGSSYEVALLQAKEQKLRDLFFQQNPEKLKYFYSTTLKQQCVNSGFENASYAGFSFFTKSFNSTNYNAPFNYTNNPLWRPFNNNPLTSFTPSPTNLATIVDSSINDPLLSNLPRVKSGRHAIMLNNNNNAEYDVTKMTRQFVINEFYISYAFALVLEKADHLDPNDPSKNKNPYYQVILRDNSNNNQIVFERRVMGNQNNPIFNNVGNGLLYTNWSCEYIDTSNLIGHTVTLEIYLADCGEGGHRAYGYFDDFCGTYCGPATFNPNLFLHPIKDQCPKFPIPITGNFTLPSNASFTNVTLQVVDNSNNVVSTHIITSAPGGNFLKNLDFYDLYPNGYNANTDFNIWAYLNYSINGIPQSSIFINNTNPPGPDISFKNCPLPCLEIWDFEVYQPIQTATNFQGAHIVSASAIYPNINVEFRAVDEIILKPAPNGTAGFYATSHQSGNFHAYIAPCDESDNFSEPQIKGSKMISKNTFGYSHIKIFPNPTSTFINIDSGNEKITSWELFDISGRSVLKGNSSQVNVQGLPKASYLLNINVNNKTVTKKVIVK